MGWVSKGQDAIRPIVGAYMKYCSSEVIPQCKEDHKSFKSHGVFSINKAGHFYLLSTN
ncbi:hypothetical protein LINPERHAP2_LOCUS21772 [Linum perenne]